MRDYGKVHTSFWSSSSVHELSEDARTLAFYLLTCPHGTIAGVFRLPDGYASEDLKWDSERVQKGFLELFNNGFACRCKTTKWVWIYKHFEWNPPENPNQKKSAAKIANQIPSDCSWRLDFMRRWGDFLGLEKGANKNPSETLSEPLPNQEQEQEQNIKPHVGDKSPRFDPLTMELPNTVNRTAWSEWALFRKSKRKPISPTAAVKQIEFLQGYDQPTQAQIISASILNDWQGLFAPKPQAMPSTSEPIRRRLQPL